MTRRGRPTAKKQKKQRRDAVSGRAREFLMCDRKIPHDTRDEAQAHIDLLVMARTKVPRKKLRIYKCDYCRKFHVTSH